MSREEKYIRSAHFLKALYTVEILPLLLRHWGPTYIHLAVQFGQFVASGVVSDGSAALSAPIVAMWLISLHSYAALWTIQRNGPGGSLTLFNGLGSLLWSLSYVSSSFQLEVMIATDSGIR